MSTREGQINRNSPSLSDSMSPEDKKLFILLFGSRSNKNCILFEYDFK